MYMLAIEQLLFTDWTRRGCKEMVLQLTGTRTHIHTHKHAKAETKKK